MSIVEISAALVSLRPDARWMLNGSDLAGLDWLDENQSRPSDEEIEAEIARLAALPPPVLTPAEKLAAAGLTVDDLIALLRQPTHA